MNYTCPTFSLVLEEAKTTSDTNHHVGLFHLVWGGPERWCKPFISVPNSELTQTTKVAAIAHCEKKEAPTDIWGKRLQLRSPKAREEKKQAEWGFGRGEAEFGHSRATVYTRDFRKRQICLERDVCSEKIWEGKLECTLNRSVKQNREPRNKPTELSTINLLQRRQQYTMGKNSLSASGVKKVGQPQVNHPLSTLKKKFKMAKRLKC